LWLHQGKQEASQVVGQAEAEDNASLNHCSYTCKKNNEGINNNVLELISKTWS
jgi:hypothetical protein